MPPKLIVEVLGDTSRLERSLARAVGDTKGFGTSIGRLGRNIAVGLAAAGAAAATAGVAAVKMGSDFSEQMQRIVGLSGVAQEQVDKFGKQVLQLAPTVGKSPRELASALYFITSSGIAASKAMDVLTNSAKASVAGLGDTEVVADAVTSAINAYGAANISAKHATDVLVATVREGKGEATAFAGVIGNVASLASQLGVSFNEVGAALAAETRLGIDAETASVQLQQVFSNLVKVAPQAEKAFKSVGLSSAGLRKELADKGLLATLTTIKDAFAGDLPGLAKAFPNIRALRGLLALVGKSADETTAIFKRMADTSGSLATAFDAVSEDTAQQFRKMRASAQVAVVAIGALFAPLAGKIADGLAAAADAVTSLVAKVTAAKTFSAKLNVVWTGINEAAQSATSALEAAFAKVDWNAVWAKASGIADGLQRRLEAIDWSKVGASIGTGIATGIAGAAAATKEIAARFEAAFKTIDWVKLGKAAGPGLAAAVVTAFATLTDPSFWLKNWDLALAVAAVAFGGPIGKLGGKLLRPIAELVPKLLEPLGRLGADLALKVLGGVEGLGGKLAKAAADAGRPLLAAFGRLVERLGGVLLDVGTKGAELLSRGLSKAVGLVGGVFDRIARRLGRPLTFLVKVLGIQAAIDAVAHLVSTIGGFFGRLADKIGHALDGAWAGLERDAIKVALAITEPFTHLPLGLGKAAQHAKEVLTQQLAAMEKPAHDAAQRVGQAIMDGLQGPLGQPVKMPTIPGLSGPTAAPTISHRDRNFIPTPVRTPTATRPTPIPTPIPTRKGLTADQRNQFFDSAISSDLGRVGFIESVKAQIAALQRIAGLISARLAATKDVTRRRTLEDQLLSVQSQIKGDQKQLGQDFLASLQFGITKAQATATFKDDVPAFQALVKGIRAQIKATGDTQDLESQLFDARQQLAAARQNVRDAKQFKILGLTATGDTPVPIVTTLKRQLANVSEAISGSFLDTSKTRSVLANIKNVLSAGIGNVSSKVRAQIKEMLDGITGQLKDHAGNLTRFRHVSQAALLDGLGLTPELRQAIGSRIAQLGAHGSLPARGPAFAFAGTTVPVPSGPGMRGGTGGFTIQGDLVVNGVQNVKQLKNELAKETKRRSVSRRTG